MLGAWCESRPRESQCTIGSLGKLILISSGATAGLSSSRRRSARARSVRGGGGAALVFAFFDTCCEFGGGRLANFGESVILRLYSPFLSTIFVPANTAATPCRANRSGGRRPSLTARRISLCNIMTLLTKSPTVLIPISSLLKIFTYLSTNATTSTASSFPSLSKRSLTYEKSLRSCRTGNLRKSSLARLCVIRVFPKLPLPKM